MVSGDPVGEAPVLAATLGPALAAAEDAEEALAAGGVVLVLELELHAVRAAPAPRAAAISRTRNFIVPPEES
jgi:hypothetical protein